MRTFSKAFSFLCLLALCLTIGCGEREDAGLSTHRGEYAVMTYNLHQYGLEDRDDDGQRNDPKPQSEVRAIIKTIAECQPEILIVQEIGNPIIYQDFKDQLAKQGLAYHNHEYLRMGQHDNNIALLTDYEIVARRPHTNDTYSIGNTSLNVSRGIIDVDVQITKNYLLRIMAAHLKSKVYHPLGQTEMRRNEARILGQHIRNALRDNPALRLLVAGDFNDQPDSAALREIGGPSKTPVLKDVRPVDSSGDAWTQFQERVDIYSRLDYILASPNLYRDLVHRKTRVVNLPETRMASDHRPLVAVFRTGPR